MSGIARVAPGALPQSEHNTKLYRSYLATAQPAPLARHRGKSPQQPGFFIRTARARLESALLASLCRMAGALPAPPAETGAPLPTLSRAHLLCQAYEAYRSLIQAPLISFEHAVFLLTSLLRGDELALNHCCGCGALLVVDRWSLRAARCAPCDEGCRGTVEAVIDELHTPGE